MERMLVSIRETGAMLGLGRSTIYPMMNEGQLEKVKLGRRTLIKVTSIRLLAEIGSPAIEIKK